MTEQDFYEHICENYGEREIVQLIKLNPHCGFYKLCQCFVDVALNAQTFKNKDGEMKRLFLREEIDAAKAASHDFCIANNIKHLDELFTIIKLEFHNSMDPNDHRRTECMIKEDDEAMNTYGYIGTLYFFCDISDEVYEKITTEIKQLLS